MSCYVKHPDLPQIECWHSPDHTGDHNKEGRSWPNLRDPLRIEIARLTDEVERLRKIWHIKRCDKWSNDGSQGTDPARRCRLAEGHEIDCDFGELERLRAERVEVLALDTPWPLTSILERLCEATDHLLSYHSCDRIGYEGVVAAREAGTALAAKLRGAP